MLRMRRRRRMYARALAAILIAVGLVYIGIIITLINVSASVNAPLNSVHDYYCENLDTTEPEISLNGSSDIYLNLNDVYEEEGFSVVDFCDIKETSMVGEVDTGKVGDYKITYSATDIGGRRSETVRSVHVKPEIRGTIYLTFDDGPGAYTAELLDILVKYGVKATFFVTGYGDDELILREYTEGHTVALHTMTHDYSYVYENEKNFFEDLYAVQERVKKITGYTSFLMRFPGGSSNLVSAHYDGGEKLMTRLVDEVEAKGFTYFDWNISSGDAGQTTSAEQVAENVISGLDGDGDKVVLQHDIKDYSVAAVAEIIEYGLSEVWVFDKLTADSFTAHHGVNN